MSDEDRPHEWFTGADIPFVKGSGYLGLGTTPGAVPIPVESLYFEGETDVYDGEVVESLWLKARRVGSKPGEDRPEHLMFFTGHERLGAIVTAIAEVSLGRMMQNVNRLSGTFEGYHDSNQVAASDDVDEGCVDDLRADVRRGNAARGMELALRTGEQAEAYELKAKPLSTRGYDRAVMRLLAELDREAVTALLAEYGRLREWQEGMRTKGQAYLRDNPSSPAPGR